MTRKPKKAPRRAREPKADVSKAVEALCDGGASIAFAMTVRFHGESKVTIQQSVASDGPNVAPELLRELLMVAVLKYAEQLAVLQ